MKISNNIPKKIIEQIEQIKDYANQFEKSETPFLIQDDRKWLYANPAARKILEVEEDIIGKPIWDFLPSENHKKVEDRILSCNNGEVPMPSEQTWITQKGNKVIVEVIGFPIMFSSSATQIILRDMTLQRQKENETLNHLKLINENMMDIVGVVDESGRFTYLTMSYEWVTGYNHAEALGTSPFDLVHPEDVERILMEFMKMITEKVPTTVEYRYLKNNGTYIWLESKGIPVIEENKTRYAIIASRDITQRKEAECALKKSERSHRIILEHTHDLICVVDTEGKYLYASPSYQEILGIDPTSIIGQTSMKFIHKNDHIPVQDYMRSVAISQKVEPLIYRKIHRDGSEVILEGKGMPMHTDSGEVEGLVFISRDITEKIKAEEILRNREKLSVVGELAAGVAHEVRNPLTSIKGLFQLLRGSENDPEKKELYHTIIEEELNRIEQIVNEFMALAKPEVMHYEDNVNIIQLLHDTVMLLSSEARLYNVEIRLLFKESEMFVSCERNQIKQVFVNVIKNAIEAMGNGGVLTIGIEEQTEGGIKLLFADTGIGIDEERLKNIGVPFFTNKEKGIGLGLTISNKIISEHRGDIKIESVRGKGTTVTIVLPRNNHKLKLSLS